MTYSGGAGYEGADVLALRVGRPSTGGCCVCIGPDRWINDWVFATEDGEYVRARVNVNRLVVRWDWKTKTSGGKRQVAIDAFVDPTVDAQKAGTSPSSKFTLGEHTLPANLLLALHSDGAVQPVTTAALRVGRSFRAALP